MKTTGSGDVLVELSRTEFESLAADRRALAIAEDGLRELQTIYGDDGSLRHMQDVTSLLVRIRSAR
jgi:hypothetical protein